MEVVNPIYVETVVSDESEVFRLRNERRNEFVSEMLENGRYRVTYRDIKAENEVLNQRVIENLFDNQETFKYSFYEEHEDAFKSKPRMMIYFIGGYNKEDEVLWASQGFREGKFDLKNIDFSLGTDKLRVIANAMKKRSKKPNKVYCIVSVRLKNFNKVVQVMSENGCMGNKNWYDRCNVW